MNAIPLINNAPRPNINVGSIGSPSFNPNGASVGGGLAGFGAKLGGSIGSISGNAMRQNPASMPVNNETQLRQEINTSLVALKKEAFSLETLIAQAAQTLVDINSRIEELEGKQGDYVKKSDVVDSITSGNMNPVTSNAVANSNAMPVNSVTSGNLHSVTSNAVNNYIASNDRNNPINDCNLATRNGIWYFSNASNCPPVSLGFKATDNSGTLIVQAYDNNWVNQICQDFYDKGALYIRSRTNNGWGSWSRVSANETWERLITLDSNSYINGKRVGNDKYIHCHFQTFRVNPLSVGQVIASNLPSDYRPSNVIRGLVDLDISTGRIPVVIQIEQQSGNVVAYPMSQTQSSGSFGDCYFYGDLLLLVV